MIAHLTHYSKYYLGLWLMACIHLHGNIVTVSAEAKKNKKYGLKFKLSAVKYAEEKSGEAAARRFSVDPKTGRDCRKNQTELQRLSEEDSSRARLPGGGRKKASEEPEINMRG